MENNQLTNKKLHIPWMLLIFSTMFEYMLDYSRFSFLNKKLVYLSVMSICLFSFIMKVRKLNLKELASVYCLIIFCSLNMVIYNIDFTYSMVWIALLAAVSIPINVYQVEKIRKLFVFFGFFLACTCILQSLNSDALYSLGRLLLNAEWEQIAKNFASWNQYPGLSYQTGSAASIMLIGLCAYFGSGNRKKSNKLVRLAVFAVMYIGIVLTSKRMPLLISIILFVVAYMYRRYIKGGGLSKQILAFLALIMVGFVVFSIALPYMSDINVIKRFSSDFGTGQVSEYSIMSSQDLTSGRTLLYKYAWMYFTENPFSGIGWCNFAETLGTSVHNIYLQLLAETGIFGLALFIYVAVKSLNILCRAIKLSVGKDEITQGVLLTCLLIQVFFLLLGFTDNPLYGEGTRTIYLFSCIVGISVFISLNSDKTEE